MNRFQKHFKLSLESTNDHLNKLSHLVDSRRNINDPRFPMRVEFEVPQLLNFRFDIGLGLFEFGNDFMEVFYNVCLSLKQAAEESRSCPEERTEEAFEGRTNTHVRLFYLGLKIKPRLAWKLFLSAPSPATFRTGPNNLGPSSRAKRPSFLGSPTRSATPSSSFRLRLPSSRQSR